MQMDLKGKNVIYIGGFGGIGQKSVEELLKLSVANLLIFDLNSNEEFLQNLSNTYDKSCVDYIHLDIAKKENIENAFKLAKEKIHHFDLVINGSGIVNEQNVDLAVTINLVRFFLAGRVYLLLCTTNYFSPSIREVFRLVQIESSNLMLPLEF